MKKKLKTVPAAPDEGTETKKKKRIGLSKRDRRERFSTSFFMIPSIAGVLAFFILPFLVVIYCSFIDDTATGDFVGLRNFTDLFNNSAFKMALKNTGIFSLTAVPLVVVLSLALAVLLDANVPYKSTFRTIFLSPMIVPAASVILIWQVLFDFNGVVNDIMAVFGAEPVEWLKSDFGYIVVVLLFLWKNIGYNPTAVAGYVGHNRAPHGWIELVHNGVTYIYDTELTMAKRLKGQNIYLYRITYSGAPYIYAKR